MRAEDNYRVEGRVIEIVRPRLFRVMLGNGHLLFAHTAMRSPVDWGSLCVDDRVTVEVTPFDLSSGRIRDVAKKNLI